MEARNPIKVSCAVIVNNGMILTAQRGAGSLHAGKWEFPGGKIEQGETPEQCLKRELREELEMEINIEYSLPLVAFNYPGKAIELHPFICSWDGEKITPGEHQQIAWVFPGDMGTLDWSEADIKVWEYLLNSGFDFNQI